MLPVAPGISVNTPGAAVVEIGEDCHWIDVAAYPPNVKVISPPKHTVAVGVVIVPALTVEIIIKEAEFEVASPHAPETIHLYCVPVAGKVAVAFVTIKVAVA